MCIRGAEPFVHLVIKTPNLVHVNFIYSGHFKDGRHSNLKKIERDRRQNGTKI